MFGHERLESALLKYAELPVETIVQRILNECMAFQQEQNDDITFLVLKRI
jgi:serine phosphatase RsbU (regulator of sigma subunit)